MIIGFLLLFSGLNAMGDVSTTMVELSLICCVESELFLLGCISIHGSCSCNKHSDILHRFCLLSIAYLL